ncbi:hypothetical protein [Pelobacter seleniigenes]|uniref:hypothetical protein n=1 Tax=Pelobacter seleniigenes TaxID=407188 RepID=UPI0004A6D337|nr:hypothetical protein [Pelobacter seleniigenes]
MTGPIPFYVPNEFAAGIANHSLNRVGTLIKDASSGRIVAHVQETGLAQKVVGSAINIPFAPLSTVSSVGANIQLTVLQKMMVTMQILQYASLGATLVGIGVSVVGFKVMVGRFNQMQSQIDDLANTMNQQFRDLEARSLREHQSRAVSLFDEAEIASSFSSPRTEWIRLSHSLAEEAAFYRGEVEYQLSLPQFNNRAFLPLVQLYAGCNSARVKCLMLADELSAAQEVSCLIADKYNALFDPLSPITLAKKFVKEEGPDLKEAANTDHALRENLERTTPLIASLRDAQEAAQTRPMLIDTLIKKGISGRDFIKRLESEKEQPILCLVP